MVRRQPKQVNFGNNMLAKFDELEKKSGIRLKVPQKILLAETGTLEQVISILANEATTVKVIQQRQRRNIIVRKSIISTSSGRVLVRAQSKIHAQNLSPNVLQLIRSKDHGIGSIIQSLELATFRKIIEIGYNPASNNLFRQYQIFIARKLCFEIREEFL